MNAPDCARSQGAPASPCCCLSRWRSFTRRAWWLHGLLIAQLILSPAPLSRGAWVDIDADGDGVADFGYDDGLTETDTDQDSPADDSESEPELELEPDADGDGLSDAQETAIGSDSGSPDSDQDGITDADEIYLTGTDPNNADSNGDGYSDYNEFYGNYTVNTHEAGAGATPYDHDGDGVEDPIDPDPYSPVNDADSDGDYVPDSEDSDPGAPWLWDDWNLDGINDSAESPGADGDGDRIADDTDSNPADPGLYNDWNGNGVDDHDEDWDGDGVVNLQDSHPDSNVLWCDWNSNGINDDSETGSLDADGDGYPMDADSHPFNGSLWSDWNADGFNDDEPISDADGDNHPDGADTDPHNSSLWEDYDRNGINDGEEPTAADRDSDGDGYADSADSDPGDSALWDDGNRNGVNDSSETTPADADGDGYLDETDSDSADGTLWEDYNRNGLNDSFEALAMDSDGDGYADHIDSDPADPALWDDGDGNGIEDSYETVISDADADGYSDERDSHATDGNRWNDWNDNGINDQDEAPPDADRDGIADGQDGYPHDFDNDGLDDDRELFHGGDPAVSDTDGDGLNDGEEVYAGTRVDAVDTDGDGLTDYEEIATYHTSPLIPTPSETPSPEPEPEPSPAQEPDDGQASAAGAPGSIAGGVPSLVGFLTKGVIAAAAALLSLTTAPAPPVAPTKRWKLAYFADLTDSDFDGIPDKVEAMYAPLVVDPDGDLDGDQVSNLNEYKNGTDLLGNTSTTDFDGDGLTDLVEDAWSRKFPGFLNKYRSADAFADPDADGLLTIEELTRTWGGSADRLAVATSPVSHTSQFNAAGGLLADLAFATYGDWMTDGALRLCTQRMAADNAALKALPAAFWIRDLLSQQQSVPRGYLLWVDKLGLPNPPVGGRAGMNLGYSAPLVPNGSGLMTPNPSAPQGPVGIRHLLPLSAVTPASADLDGDGMPNAWEARYKLAFRDATNAGPASGLIADYPLQAPAKPAFAIGTAPVAPVRAKFKTDRIYQQAFNFYLTLKQNYDTRVAAWADYHTQLATWNTLRPIDPDHDGLGNRLEFYFGTNPLIPDWQETGSRDSDGDGFTNADEIRAGSNPFLKASVPPLTLTLVSGDGQSTETRNLLKDLLVVKAMQAGRGVPNLQLRFESSRGGHFANADHAVPTFAASPLTIATAEDGVASVIFLAPDFPGALSVTASAGPAATAAFTMTVDSSTSGGGGGGGGGGNGGPNDPTNNAASVVADQSPFMIKFEQWKAGIVYLADPADKPPLTATKGIITYHQRSASGTESVVNTETVDLPQGTDAAKWIAANTEPKPPTRYTDYSSESFTDEFDNFSGKIWREVTLYYSDTASTELESRTLHQSYTDSLTFNAAVGSLQSRTDSFGAWKTATVVVEVLPTIGEPEYPGDPEHEYQDRPVGPAAHPEGWTVPKPVGTTAPVDKLKARGDAIPFAPLRVRAGGELVAVAESKLEKREHKYYNKDKDEVTMDAYTGSYQSGKLTIAWRDDWPFQLSPKAKEAWIKRFLVIIERTQPGSNGQPATTTTVKPLSEFISGDLFGSNGQGGPLPEMEPGVPEVGKTKELRLSLVCPTVVELSPTVKDEDANDVPGSDKPSRGLPLTPFVEEFPHANRIAHREMKVMVGEAFKGKRVTWTLAEVPDATPATIRGEWSDSPIAAHQNCFEKSDAYGDNGFRIASGTGKDARAETTVAADGHTAIRVNVPPIGFNQARIKVQIEGTSVPIDLIDMEVPGVVVIDPGHGDHDSGAVGRTDDTVLEKDLALAYSLSLRQTVIDKFAAEKHGLMVVMTRKTTDEYLDNTLRAELARDKGADVFLSIHFNDAGKNKDGSLNTTARGTEYVSLSPGLQASVLNETEDDQFGVTVQGTTLAAVRASDAGARHRDPKYGSYFALKDTSNGNTANYHPLRGVIVEVEFLSHETALETVKLSNATGTAIKTKFAADVSTDIYNNILNHP